MKWLIIEELQPPEDLSYKPKTKRWAVYTKDYMQDLGTIKWHNSWRKYAFFPFSNTLFEQDCLRDISNFIEEQTKLHRREVT